MVVPLLTAHDATGHVHLVLGSNSVAHARCTRSTEAGAIPILICGKDDQMHHALRQKVEDGSIRWLQRDFEDQDLQNLGREDADHVVDAVFITTGPKSSLSSHVSSLCRRLRIPVNVLDSQHLSSFALLSTHSDGPLQVGITTSGKGCKLASRIKREIASVLPPNLGSAIDRLGTMRRRILEEDNKAPDSVDAILDASDDDAPVQKSTFNKLISETDADAAKTRRIRWLSQICEYWPLTRLASVTDQDIDCLLKSYRSSVSPTLDRNGATPNIGAPKPTIVLAGSGPGAPQLLTVATRDAIQSASVILADKLVPAPVLELIPRRTPVHIARKFPGNADAAQQELLELGLEALSKGLTVLRLKQGDPYIYGRGGEEYTFFKEHGYDPIVLPGITSALSAPLFAAIPATHRSISDQVLICTGTGRKGAAPSPPPYVKTQTVVFLMALHRLNSLIDSLVASTNACNGSGSGVAYLPWPTTTPCAIIERASCSDQRVIRTTLQHVVSAVEEEGSRPPGLLVVGYACEVLKNTSGRKWIVEEGFTGLGGLSDLPHVELSADTAISPIPI